ncbi:hypothetical protein [Streptomyces sp. PU-14G]
MVRQVRTGARAGGTAAAGTSGGGVARLPAACRMDVAALRAEPRLGLGS